MTPELFLRGLILILPLALVLACGNFLAVKGFLTPSDRAAISKVIFWVVAPAMLFRNIFHIEGGAAENMRFFGAIVVASLMILVIAYVLERFIFRVKDKKRIALTAAASVRPNTLYIGLPLVESVFGAQAVVHLTLYASFAIPLYNLLAPLSSEIVLSRGSDLKAFLKNMFYRIITNPMVVAPLCGMILVLLGVKHLPESLDKSLHMLSNAATGMSLLVLGASIDVKHAKVAVMTSWREILERLFVHPALLYICLTFIGTDVMLRNVSVLVTATPAAATLFILAQGIGLDGKRAAELTVITMLLSAITLPMWIVFLGV